MSRTIYKITVLKWNNHNSKHKDSFKKTLIANNFCGDAKVKVLPASVRWMFLGLLLLCGDMSKDTVEVADSSLRDLLGSGYSSSKALSLLQSFQLLTYEKIDFLRIEVKRNEVKRIEKKEKETAPDFIEVDFKSLEKENGPVKTIKPKHETFEVQIAELYLKIYPLKKGKTAGLKTLTKAIKTNEDLKNLETAILNYKKQIKNPEYTMHFSTFANQWKDWLDENAGSLVLGEESENFKCYFEDFAINILQTKDLGFAPSFHSKTHSAFGSISGFEEFAAQVTNTKKFKESQPDDQLAYFKTALSNELRNRGCL